MNIYLVRRYGNDFVYDIDAKYVECFAYLKLKLLLPVCFP